MRTLPMHLAETQHGLVTTGQLRAAALSDAQIRWAVTDGRLIRLSPRLFRVRGAPESTAQRVLAAVLDAGPGSALSHTSALAWWDVPGFPLDELHVTHQRDDDRLARLDAAGFEVATVTDTDVWHRTWHVVQAVRDGRLKARARQTARTPTAA